jgi:hypothetical protein
VNGQQAVPASVRFASGMSIVVEDDFDKVADRLARQAAQLSKMHLPQLE